MKFNGKDIVALVLAGTILLSVGLYGLLAYLMPGSARSTENLALWIDLFQTISGGLLVYIGTKNPE